MRTLLFLLLSITMFSCANQSTEDAQKAMWCQTWVVTYDSCEYVVHGMHNQQWGTHKGNCKFCLERSKR